jgi:hypothetical protein
MLIEWQGYFYVYTKNIYQLQDRGYFKRERKGDEKDALDMYVKFSF